MILSWCPPRNLFVCLRFGGLNHAVEWLSLQLPAASSESYLARAELLHPQLCGHVSAEHLEVMGGVPANQSAL